MGDFEDCFPDHHGTWMESASAATDGFDLAAKVDSIDTGVSARRFWVNAPAAATPRAPAAAAPSSR